MYRPRHYSRYLLLLTRSHKGYANQDSYLRDRLSCLGWLRPYIDQAVKTGYGRDHPYGDNDEAEAEAEAEAEPASDKSIVIRVPPETLARLLWEHPTTLPVFRELLNLAEFASSQLEGGFDDSFGSSSSSFSTIPGVAASQLLAWSAAVLAQSIKVGGSRRNNRGASSSHHCDEVRVRILLPAVLRAVGAVAPPADDVYARDSASRRTLIQEWRHWGYVVASALAQHFPALQRGAIDQIAIRVLDPFRAERSDEHGYYEYDEDEDEDEEAGMTALATFLSLLRLSRRRTVAIERGQGGVGGEETDYYMEIVPYLPTKSPKAEEAGSGSDGPTVRLGCRLSRSVVAEVLSLATDPAGAEWLGRHLAHLARSEGVGAVAVAPFVVSLAVAALRQLQGASASARAPSETSQLLLKQLLRQSVLWKPIAVASAGGGYRLVSLVASLARAVLLTCRPPPSSSAATADGFFGPIQVLEALYALSPRECERGGAAAAGCLNCTTSRAQADLSLLDWSHHVPWLLAAGSVVASPDAAMPAASKNRKREGIHSVTSPQGTIVLPPRVALEHADPLVRLDAVRQLLRKSLQPLEIARGEDGATATTATRLHDAGEESVVESLLRRWSADDDERVAIATCKAIGQLLDKVETESGVGSSCIRGDGSRGKMFSRYALDGLDRWIVRVQNQPRALESGIRMAVSVSRWLGSDGAGDNEDFRVLEWLVGLLDLDEQETSSAIISITSRAILTMLDRDVDAGSALNDAEIVVLAKSYVLQNERFLSSIVHAALNSPSLNRRSSRCLWVVLREVAGKVGSDDNLSTIGGLPMADLLQLCLDRLKDDPLLDKHLLALQKCLKLSGSQLSRSEVPTFVTSLMNVLPQRIYTKVAKPVVQQVIACTNREESDGATDSPYSLLLEAGARPGTSALATERILLLAADLVSKEIKNGSPALALALGLCMLDSYSRQVRLAAVDLLERIPQACLEDSLSVIPRCAAKLRVTASLGSRDLLSGFLKQCHSEAALSESLGVALVRLAAACALPVGGGSLPAQAVGAFTASAALLEAMEVAGEQAFSVQIRWIEAGAPILRSVMKAYTEPPAKRLMEAVVRMMGGVKVSGPRVVILTGPGDGGGRSRSYSVDVDSGTSVLDPFPDDMVSTIVDVLSASGESECVSFLANQIVKLVLGSHSWRTSAFHRLKHKQRVRIASSLLAFLCSGLAYDGSEALFHSLPFTVSDVSSLFGQHGWNGSSISFLCDYVRSNASRLQAARDVGEIVSKLFRACESLAHEDVEDASFDPAFMQQTLLVAISELVHTSDDRQDRLLSARTVEENLSKLTGLFTATSTRRQLGTRRARAAALSILASFSGCAPKIVVPALLPVLLATVGYAQTVPSGERHLSDCLAVLLPVVRRHGKGSGVRLVDLFSALLGATRLEQERWHSASHRAIVEVLVQDKDKTVSGQLLASFVMTYLATECQKRKADETDTQQGILTCLSGVASPVLLSCAARLLAYATSLAFRLSRSKPSTKDRLDEFDSTILIPLDDLVGLVDPADPTGSKLDTLGVSALQTFGGLIQQRAIQAHARKAQGDSSIQLISLWEDVIMVECSIRSIDLGPDHLATFAAFSAAAQEARQALQEILPSHLLLACLSSILSEAADPMKETAMTLLADWVADVDPHSPEAQLVLDLVPSIVQVINGPSAGDESASIQLSALFSLERIARVLGPFRSGQPAKKDTRGEDPLVNAFAKCSDLLQKFKGVDRVVELASRDLQLVSSLSLTCSTLVHAVGARCLASLSRFLKPVLRLLETANRSISESHFGSSDRAEQVRVLQLSLLRGVRSVLDTVPQFVSSHLPVLLTEKVLLSPALRPLDATGTLLASSTLSGISQTVIAIDAALSKVPSRILVPAAWNALRRPVREEEDDDLATAIPDAGRAALIQAVTVSLEPAVSAEALSHQSSIMEMVVDAASPRRSYECRSAAVKLLLSTVLKLSEIQLRQLYAWLHDWWRRQQQQQQQPAVDVNRLGAEAGQQQRRRLLSRTSSPGGGGDGGDDDHDDASLVFWKLSLALSEELLTLFLPCVAMVLDDAVSQLTAVVDALDGSSGGSRSRSERPRSKKRRRIAAEGAASADGTLCPPWVPVLLGCLEQSFRSDGRSNGGAWTRVENGRRFRSVLRPVGRLLRSPSPPLSAGVPGQGHEAVRDAAGRCLVALAAAAGSEELWKPLNRSLLEACSFSSRSTSSSSPAVVLCGLKTLRDAMEAVGEEYMTLVPECLPTLSELLEDADDRISSAARSCVRLAEELLGESLEANL
jgi:U3 small nucleolar RNA-associated protein 10